MDTQNTDRTIKPNISPEALRAKLSSLHHSMNNPLAVISGNVQLLQELSSALSVTDEMGGPLRDIATAVEQLTTGTDQLVLLRGLIQAESN